jgi:nucleotide-binding universal stress UspA family protein
VASLAAPAGVHRDVPPPFGRIVCAVDGSRTSHLAIDQAIALSGPATALVFVCVRDASGVGATRQATISVERAHNALDDAVKAAAEAGVDAAAEILPGNDPSVLLDEASRSDLLVVASHVSTRAGGIALSDTASTAVHCAGVPVLVARRPPEGVGFPDRILVATDGSRDAERAVELTARIAGPYGAQVYVVAVDPARHGDPKQIAAQAVDLTSALGAEPTMLRPEGRPDECILYAAAAQGASLVAVGSRGLKGLRALGSVSERVANRAHCSVLVARRA